MSLKTFHSIKTLVAYGEHLAHDVELVSFDLFDTLMIRRIHDPDKVKNATARYITNLADQAGINIWWPKVQKYRDDHEQALRDKTGAVSPDFEAHYPTFMAQTLRTIFKHDYDDNLLKKVTQYELKMESAMLVPRQELVEWMAKLHDSGKKIFVITDMYLPATHIQTLLKAGGLMQHIDHVISSADSAHAKASGAAFSMLTKKYQLNPQKWMHIGDNPISDGQQAHLAGLTALVLQDWRESWRRGTIARYYNYSQNQTYWAGRSLQQLMAPLEAENTPRSDLYIEGYNFFGPVMGYYIQSIAEYCRNNNVEKLYFCSREGWLFQQYWQKCIDYLYPDQALPEIEYLYVSRMALANASCGKNGLTWEKIKIAFLPKENKDFQDICRVYGLDITQYESFLTHYELKQDTVLRSDHSRYQDSDLTKFSALLKDNAFQETIKQQTQPNLNALELYLTDVGFFSSQDAAIVDIGWLGTIQKLLHEAISHREDRPNLHGLLFAATRGMPYEYSDDNKLQGIIYDRCNFELAASSILYAQDIFEEACRAPHATLMSYELTQTSKKTPGYRLNFRKMDDQQGQSETKQNQIYADLQKGILDAAPRYGAASIILSDSAFAFRSWLNYLLVSKLAFAKYKEINTLQFAYHLDDFKGSGQGVGKQSFNIPGDLWTTKGWKLRLLLMIKRLLFSLFRRKMINQL